MEDKNKLNIILGLMILVFFMQLFLKPSVEINDRDWDIKSELEDLNEGCRNTNNDYEFTKCWYINTTQYCKSISGHGEYNEIDDFYIELIDVQDIEDWYVYGHGVKLNYSDLINISNPYLENTQK